MASEDEASEELSSRTIALQVASTGDVPGMDSWKSDSSSDVRGSSIQQTEVEAIPDDP